MAGIFPDSGVPAIQATNTVNTNTVNCTELFHSTSRCVPRFDPAAANAVMSELLNLAAALGIVYDCSRLNNLALGMARICSLAVAANPTPTSGLLFCNNGVLSTSTFSNFLDKACYDLPAAPADLCSVETVAYVTDAAGCGKLMRYTAAAAGLGSGRYYHVARALGVPEPAATINNIWPDDLIPNPYTQNELRAVLGTIDGNSIPANQADEARLARHAFAQVTVTVNCPTPIEYDYRLGVESELQLYNGFLYWRYKEQGTNIWRYPRSGADDLVAVAAHNPVVNEVNETSVPGPTLPAGTWIFQMFVAPGNAATPVKYNFTDVPGGISGPRVVLRRRAS